MPEPVLTESVTEPGHWQWVEPQTFTREWCCPKPDHWREDAWVMDEWILSRDGSLVQRIYQTLESQ